MPVVAITLGDPAGVGPEVALRAAAAEASRARSRVRLVLVGDPEVARETAARIAEGRGGPRVAIAPIEAAEIADPGEDESASGRRRAHSGKAGRTKAGQPAVVLPVLAPGLPRPLPALAAGARRPGRPSRAGARSAYASIRTAVALAQAGIVDAICTAPISKEWFSRAGVADTGHTEILAALCEADDVRLMMALPDFRVVLATTHLALRDVPAALSVAGIADTVRITADHLRRWWGIGRPRIAVAALNPHAGDGGVYGDEERRVIAPAIARVRRSSAAACEVVGPVPADTLFSALGPRADAVVAMYHDQGLIPVKMKDVHSAVNVTLGLPFVRTSPDHGTAFAIAGENRADPRSMQAALGLAIHLTGIERRP